MTAPIDRRRFLTSTAAGLGVAGLGLIGGCSPNKVAVFEKPEVKPFAHLPDDPVTTFPANKPNVILIRFGGGVRRLETIDDPDKTYCPFILHELAGKQGVLFEDVEISHEKGIDTSHGQGTLYLLTGEYRHYSDIEKRPFADRFEASIPTIPEYIRKRYSDVAEHQALIINGEDRKNEEYYTFSNHRHYGMNYRSMVLSLHGFKTYLLREQLKSNDLSTSQRAEKEKKLKEMLDLDYRVEEVRNKIHPELQNFWAGWRKYYGDSGFVNPRGDRLLTLLTLRALKELRPRFIMVNYNDPDYVHWGPGHFYTRAISIIDEGVREIYHAVQADEHYRNNTVFVIAPDCGRDNNRCMSVPFQHHFNSKSAHEIFAIVAGPKKFVPHAGKRVDRRQQQISVAATIGELMGYTAKEADAESLFKVV